MPDQPGPSWTWNRLVRVLVVAFFTLAIVDFSLRGFDKRLEKQMADGELRNGPGLAVADGTRMMLLESDADVRSQAIAFSGSSISYGSSLSDNETIPAQTAHALRDANARAPVFNLSQHGGAPIDAVPIAAAF